jgi:hypothetical protein
MDVIAWLVAIATVTAVFLYTFVRKRRARE